MLVHQGFDIKFESKVRKVNKSLLKKGEAGRIARVDELTVKSAKKILKKRNQIIKLKLLNKGT